MTNKTYRELLQDRAELEKQIEALESVERQKAIEQINELMELFSITAPELGRAPKKGRKVSKPAVDKYRDPASGKTWSGRGKPPLWIKDKDRDLFTIQP
jgi:DNA-binding protein H-NS